MSGEREWVGKKEGWVEWNLLGWRPQLKRGGRGSGKLIPPATWRRPEKVAVVGSSLRRALGADRVTMKRWRDGNWGKDVGAAVVVVVSEGDRRVAKVFSGRRWMGCRMVEIASRCMKERPLLCFNAESRNLIKVVDSIKESLAYHSYANWYRGSLTVMQSQAVLMSFTASEAFLMHTN